MLNNRIQVLRVTPEIRGAQNLKGCFSSQVHDLASKSEIMLSPHFSSEQTGRIEALRGSLTRGTILIVAPRGEITRVLPYNPAEYRKMETLTEIQNLVAQGKILEAQELVMQYGNFNNMQTQLAHPEGEEKCADLLNSLPTEHMNTLIWNGNSYFWQYGWQLIATLSEKYPAEFLEAFKEVAKEWHIIAKEKPTERRKIFFYIHNYFLHRLETLDQFKQQLSLISLLSKEMRNIFSNMEMNLSPLVIPVSFHNKYKNQLGDSEKYFNNYLKGKFVLAKKPIEKIMREDFNIKISLIGDKKP